MNTVKKSRCAMLKQRCSGFQALIVCLVAYGSVLIVLEQSTAWLGSTTAPRAVQGAASVQPNHVFGHGKSLTLAAEMKQNANASLTWPRCIATAVAACACIMQAWNQKQPNKSHARRSERAVVTLHAMQCNSEIPLQTRATVPLFAPKPLHEPEPVREHNLLGLVSEHEPLTDLNLLGLEEPEMLEQPYQSNVAEACSSGAYGQQRKQRRAPHSFARGQRERRHFGKRLGSAVQYEPRVESYDPSRVRMKLQCGLQIHRIPSAGGSSESSVVGDAKGPISFMDSSQMFIINSMEATGASKLLMM